VAVFWSLLISLFEVVLRFLWHETRKDPNVGGWAMRNSGQGLVEYLILVCLIAVSTIAIVGVVGKNVREQYANISATIRGDRASIRLTKPDSQTYDYRGMDDFTEGAKRAGH